MQSFGNRAIFFHLKLPQIFIIQQEIELMRYIYFAAFQIHINAINLLFLPNTNAFYFMLSKNIVLSLCDMVPIELH